MKMSSCGSGLEGDLVTQHRPEDVDPPTGQSDQGLGVLLALPSPAVVEALEWGEPRKLANADW